MGLYILKSHRLWEPGSNIMTSDYKPTSMKAGRCGLLNLVGLD